MTQLLFFSNMDPGWLFLFGFLVVEIFVVSILIFPMPSNQVRGAIIDMVTKAWENSPFLRYLMYTSLSIDIYYLINTIRRLFFRNEKYLHVTNPEIATGSHGEHYSDCEQKMQLFLDERNLYLTGFSIFLFFVMLNILHIQQLLHGEKLKNKSTTKKLE